METYTLLNLLMFLKRQQKSDYKVIEAILEILEDQRIPSNERVPIVISILRDFGLEEEGFIEDPEDFIIDPDDRIKYLQPYRIDQLRIPIMNSIIPYDAVLN